MGVLKDVEAQTNPKINKLNAGGASADKGIYFLETIELFRWVFFQLDISLAHLGRENNGGNASIRLAYRQVCRHASFWSMVD